MKTCAYSRLFAFEKHCFHLGSLARSAFATALLTVPTAAQAMCPDDWLEGLAMVATGGIYCQYDEARDLFNDYKSKLDQIHAQGQAELDSLKQQYAEQTQQQIQASDAELKRIEDRMAFLLREAQGVPDKLHATAVSTVASAQPEAAEPVGRFRASTVTGRGKALGGGMTEEEKKRAEEAKRALGDQRQGGGGVVIGNLQGAKDRVEETHSGPFTAAANLLNKATADVQCELDQGFQDSLFAPLTAIGAGFPTRN
jgi:hypothetical protein